MIKVALVKDNGEVAYTVSPAVDDMYIDGETYNGCTARHISHTSNDQDVIAKWYWDGKWRSRRPKPNDWFDWLNNAWVFNSVKFFSVIRSERHFLIGQSDWTQLPDSPLTKAQKTSWADYRQSLRNIPETYSDATSLTDIIWPTKPE
jgi:hypothetical protein